MLPPESTTTTGGSNACGSSSSAATPAAPAGSTTSLARSRQQQQRARQRLLRDGQRCRRPGPARSRTAPARASRPRCRRPSWPSRSSATGCPAASDGGYAAASSACTPTTRTSGRRDLTATRDAGEQPAAAGAHDDRLDVGHLLEDLQADRALPGDDVVVVERVDEDRTGLVARTPAPRRSASSTESPVEAHLGAVRTGRLRPSGSGRPPA